MPVTTYLTGEGDLRRLGGVGLLLLLILGEGDLLLRKGEGDRRRGLRLLGGDLNLKEKFCNVITYGFDVIHILQLQLCLHCNPTNCNLPPVQ